MNKMIKCCFCNKEIQSVRSNNAEPIIKNGKCCSECNKKFVIPARLFGVINGYEQITKNMMQVTVGIQKVEKKPQEQKQIKENIKN